MIKVCETMKLDANTNIIVCEYFDDSVVQGRLMSNVEEYKNFSIEQPKNCFSLAKTRNIVVRGKYDVSDVKFINFMK